MKAFYEFTRENTDEIFVQQNLARNFPEHFHASLEVFIVTSGRHTVTQGGKQQTLTPGCVIVFDSYDIHGYDGLNTEADPNGGDCVVIIPYKYLGEFNRVRGKRKIDSRVITDPELCRELLGIAEKYLADSADCSQGVKKAAVKLFLSLLSERLTFSDTKSGDDSSLIRTILTYIHGNFKSDISLSVMADELGFSEAYISRMFHKYIKKSFSSYVNALRIDYINELRSQGDKRKTIDLIYEAGFQSQQTYYRWVKRSAYAAESDGA